MEKGLEFQKSLNFVKFRVFRGFPFFVQGRSRLPADVARENEKTGARRHAWAAPDPGGRFRIYGTGFSTRRNNFGAPGIGFAKVWLVVDSTASAETPDAAVPTKPSSSEVDQPMR